MRKYKKCVQSYQTLSPPFALLERKAGHETNNVIPRPKQLRGKKNTEWLTNSGNLLVWDSDKAVDGTRSGTDLGGSSHQKVIISYWSQPCVLRGLLNNNIIIATLNGSTEIKRQSP